MNEIEILIDFMLNNKTWKYTMLSILCICLLLNIIMLNTENKRKEIIFILIMYTISLFILFSNITVDLIGG